MKPSQIPVRHQVFAVSDATGATTDIVVQSALAQFPGVEVEIRRLPNVRTIDQVRRAIETARASRGIVVHTLVSEELRQEALREARKQHVAIIDLLGPLLLQLSEALALSPVGRPGLFRPQGEDFLRRMEVMEYTVKHDDGQDPFGFDRADIVLVGISRTCKTPLSIYLAGKGWRVANVPVILNLPLPGPLMRIAQSPIIGLIMAAERLVELRLARLQHQDAPSTGAYADLEKVRSELRYSRSLFRKAGWPVIDITSKSIEEAAAEVLALRALGGAAVPAAKGEPHAPQKKAAKGGASRRSP